MKLYKLADTISLHDILKSRIPEYSSNRDLVNALNCNDFSSYPIYGDKIAKEIESD